MDLEREIDKAQLQSNIEAVGDVAMAGFAAICGELARLGALDGGALGRIADFMNQTIDRTAAGVHLRDRLHDEVDRHFEHLQQTLGTLPNNAGTTQ
jgi:hypothetical protein